MLDTRIEGRDRQYDNFKDADRGIGRYLAGTTPNAAGIRPDASHQMMSSEQQNWLTSSMRESTATWQMLAGDSHDGWFSHLTTVAGEKVGVEFAGTSVTSTGFKSAGLGALASSVDGSALMPQLGNAAIGAG